MRRWLLAAAALTFMAVVFAGLTGTAEAIPSRYFGVVTIDGARASVGVALVAEMNGKDCSTAVPFTGDPGGLNYNIDVASDSEISGCGGVGSPYVFFKVGGRYATEIGCFSAGAFVQQNVTISGAATRPVPAAGLCGTTASPSPTPAASPSPTPAPGGQAFSLSILDMNSPCIPATGSTQCDAARQALWTGDQTAWTARYQMMGRPAPTPDQVFDATLSFRVEAGDPGAISAIAQVLGWPHVRINASRYRGVTANEQDEWVELKNMGGGSQDMTGWSVRVEGTNIRWTFPDGFVLGPGQACKFYSGAAMADPCMGSSTITSGGAVLPNTSGTLTLWVDFLDLLAIRTSYDSDPNMQPVPPNLQGFG